MIKINCDNAISMTSCLAGMCPNCRYVNPMRPDLPIDAAELIDAGNVPDEPKFNGDRILVNKYVYTVSDPNRWDVVVFKFPGNAQMNYIKRLVGLPGETIRVYQGNLFTSKEKNPGDADFSIARKPADVLLAMRQLVHDTNYDPSELYKAGWPLRWQPQEVLAAGMSKRKPMASRSVSDTTSMHLRAKPPGCATATRFPAYDDWRQVEDYTIAAKNGPPDTQPPGTLAQPQLITDFTAYNTRVSDANIRANRDLEVDRRKLGLHWVGDLMVEADVDVEEAKGELIVDLVEAGKHFTATIDLATGRAVLGAEGLASFAPAADTSINKPGTYRVALANIDDQLRLWVDGTLVDFDASTEYNADDIWGSRENIIPQTSDSTTPATWRPSASALAAPSSPSRGCKCGATSTT